jgi:hypothetical protein
MMLFMYERTRAQGVDLSLYQANATELIHDECFYVIEMVRIFYL